MRAETAPGKIFVMASPLPSQIGDTVTSRQIQIREFAATHTARCSKVAKVQADRPSPAANFERLLERAEFLLRFDRFGSDIGFVGDRLRSMADSHPALPESLFARLDSFLAAQSASSRFLSV